MRLYAYCFLRGVLNLFPSEAKSTKNEHHAADGNRALLPSLSRGRTFESKDVVQKTRKRWQCTNVFFAMGQVGIILIMLSKGRNQI